MFTAFATNSITLGLDLPATGPASEAIPQPLLVADPTPAQMLEDDGSADRIYDANELRMLSQRIATEACAWLARIEGAEAHLAASVAKFNRYIAGLRDDDAELGIPTAETDRKILADIEAVHAIWDPLHDVLDDVLANGPDRDEVLHVALQAKPLFEVTDHLVFLVIAEYSNPTQLLQVDAIAMDVAGRQEKLAEEIAKDACLLFMGVGDADLEREEMIAGIELFEVSLTALHDGLPEAGISPPPTEEITLLLESLRIQWDPVQPILARLGDGQEVTHAELVEIYKTMTALTDGMGEATYLYAQASKLGL